MRKSPDVLYRLLLARDPLHDGSFFTGVLTTGIYCLPSCRARKPLQENVRFFPSCQAARDAGLRACLKCHPDDYEAGQDPVLESIEAVVREVRDRPAGFSGAEAVVARSGYGTTRAFELFRQHYHTTPAELLADARVRRAGDLLLTSKTSLADVAAEVGFESLSAFHDGFRQRMGLTPGNYRKLGGASLSFQLALPTDFDWQGWITRAARDPLAKSERVADDGAFRAAVALADGRAARLKISRQKDGTAEVSLCTASDSQQSLSPAVTADSVRRVRALLGLEHNIGSFIRLADKLKLGRLVAGHEALRPPRSWNAWESLVWAILGQQINLTFTCKLRRTLTELAGTDAGEGLRATPQAGAILRVSDSTLQKHQFSRQKIATLKRVAERVVDGRLDLVALETASATRVARTLGEITGIGPWTVNYVMLRGFGWPDCVPYGDTGVTSGLKKLHKLDSRPDPETTRRLMLPLSPHRSLATAHLWHL
ncbi:MAG: Ada metal-binding domain-containing protein [Opitutaceae bacterium]|nr:Ada metal-binding domain-containing protein [Opitutaceae bacterium]